MPKHVTRLPKPLQALSGALVVFGVCTGQLAMAGQPHSRAAFTNASLRGSYTYINSTSDVASFGPLTFDGNGGVIAALEVNLPCTNPVPNCSRNIQNITGTGTYSIQPNGIGVATINFPTGSTTYRFMIFDYTWTDGSILATKVFATGETGGLAGQLIAPTWVRRW